MIYMHFHKESADGADLTHRACSQALGAELVPLSVGHEPLPGEVFEHGYGGVALIKVHGILRCGQASGGGSYHGGGGLLLSAAVVGTERKENKA